MSYKDRPVQRHAQAPPEEELSSPPPPNSLQKFIRDCLTPEYHGLVASYSEGNVKQSNNPKSANLFFHSSPPRIPFSLQEEREQALRDYKVTIEYKHLKSHAPGGVYLIPSMDNLRKFYGVIFVRRGPFTNGIFKFSLKLPPKYNDRDMWPQIVFSSHVFNPYINEKTGELDIKSAYPTWDPSRHYLVTVLTYLKKIFYSKNFTDAHANPQAKELAESNPDTYRQKVEECVRESQKNVYVNEEGSTTQFTEEQVSHRVLRDLLKHHIHHENQVTKQAVLTQVENAQKV
jgi:ubiquitin-protein ligase